MGRGGVVVRLCDAVRLAMNTSMTCPMKDHSRIPQPPDLIVVVENVRRPRSAALSFLHKTTTAERPDGH